MNSILVELGFDTGFYLGGMKQKDLDISETKPIILGTFSMSIRIIARYSIIE